MKNTRIVIVEDDKSYAGILAEVLRLQPGFEVVATYASGVRFLAAIPTLVADVVLLDVNMPGVSGIDCLTGIGKFQHGLKILLLTVHDDTELILRAFLEGADGYLLKGASRRQIVEAIEDARNDGAPMSPAIARKVVGLLGRLGGGQNKPAGSNSAEQLLSAREYEILQLLASGRKYSEIARDLCVSLPTIKTHVSHIYQKLKVRNKVEAIAFLT